MSAAFTPGPWDVRSYDTSFWVVSADGIKVVQTSWHDGIRKPYPLKPEARANARLIAAAPELYAALRHLNELAKMPDRPLREWTEAKAEADAILAKARGEA